MIKVNVRRKRNPTNKKLLAEVQIEKLLITRNEYWTWGNPGQLLYRIKIKSVRNIGQDRTIGQARYDPKLKVIDDISIDEKYRRQGLATYLYDYIEQDQKVKLKPSDYLLEPGKEFWKARSKNPRDDDFLAKVNIVKYNLKNSPYTNYVAYLNNREVVSEASFDRESKKVELIRTEDKYKRKGLANLIYDYIEEDQKIKLKPSSILLSDGKAFWKARRKAVR